MRKHALKAEKLVVQSFETFATSDATDTVQQVDGCVCFAPPCICTAIPEECTATA
ncbi:MAG TPA: hypothetical protein VFR37_19450 [Longimicrobium sp.]|nr:hypothetical protein [Longimicrobium sp.]